MADVKVVGKDFDLGFISDIPRDQLPRGAAYRIRDYIPRAGAPLRGRGGFEWATPPLSSVSAADFVSGLAWAPFPGDPHLAIVSDTGKLFRAHEFDGAGGLSFVGQAVDTHHPPFWHGQQMVILPMGGEDDPPQKYTSDPYAVGDLGGSPPHAAVGASWLGGAYLILANGFAKHAAQGTVDERYPHRMWFSPPGEFENWTSPNSFWDFPEAIIGVIPRRNVIMVWGYSGVHVLTGDIPPPGGNLALQEYAFNQGTFDSCTLARYREHIIWANNAGVWRSDGATITDLTEQGGISRAYHEAVKDFSPNQGWNAAGGVYRGYYFLTITNDLGENLTTFVCDLDNISWFECRNIQANKYAARLAGPGTALADGSEELFIGHRSEDRVGKISSLWTPSVSTAADADGFVVEPELETPYYKLDTPAFKRLRRMYLTYDQHAVGSNTFMDVSMSLDPDDHEAYVPLRSLPSTERHSRRSADIRRKAYGVAFKIAQSGPSSSTSLGEIELEGHPMEASR